jgi:hypothetical protein
MSSNRILPEFQDFLLSRKLVPEKNVPYYARWVNKFLAFSKKSGHLDHDTLLSEFIHSLRSEDNIADWQLLQAGEALELYIHHFKGIDVLKEARGETRAGKGFSDFPRLLGHKNVETTMIYTHVLRDMKSAPQSPLDALYGSRQ